jgi:hypothetical protein
MRKLRTLFQVATAALASAMLLSSAAACELNRIPQGDCNIDSDYVIDCRPDTDLTDL